MVDKSVAGSFAALAKSMLKPLGYVGLFSYGLAMITVLTPDYPSPLSAALGIFLAGLSIVWCFTALIGAFRIYHRDRLGELDKDKRDMNDWRSLGRGEKFFVMLTVSGMVISVVYWISIGIAM